MIIRFGKVAFDLWSVVYDLCFYVSDKENEIRNNQLIHPNTIVVKRNKKTLCTNI